MARKDKHAVADDPIDALLYAEQYLPSGIKKYRYRTDEEKVAMCGRFMYTQRDSVTRVPYDVYEWPCKKKECAKCMSRRKWKRNEEFAERIAMSGSGTLFHKLTPDNDDLRRLRRACGVHGYEFFAIPTGNADEREVFINGEVKGSVAIDLVSATDIARNYGGMMTSKKVSGTLGKQTKEKKKEPDVSGKIRTEQRTIQYMGVMRPDNLEYANASLAASVKTGFTELTENNLQDYINKNDEDLVEVLKLMGFHPYLGKAVEIFVDLEAMKKHLLVLTVEVILRGDKTAVHPETGDLVNVLRERVAKYAVDTSFEWATSDKSVC